MKDKSTILAEARQKAEEELTGRRKLVSLYLFVNVMGLLIFCSCCFTFVMWQSPVGTRFYVIFLICFSFLAWWEMRRRLYTYPMNALKVFETEPQGADDYIERAGILYGYKFYEAAVDDYRTALKMEPDNDLAWYDLAETLWRELRRSDEALPIVEKLGGRESDYQASALVFQGEILAEQDPEAAIKCFDQAIDIEPDDFDHQLARLRFYVDTDRLDQATEAIVAVAKVQRKGWFHQCATFSELCGVMALKQGRPADAVKELGKAIRLDSSKAEYYHIRSDAHAALGDHDKADADRRKAQELADDA